MIHTHCAQRTGRKKGSGRCVNSIKKYAPALSVDLVTLVHSYMYVYTHIHTCSMENREHHMVRNQCEDRSSLLMR